MPSSVVVLGAGAFGQALAKVLADNGAQVTIGTKDGDWPQLISDAALVVSAVPMGAVADVAGQAKPYVGDKTVIVSATKGLHTETLQFASQIWEEVLDQHTPSKILALSGPSFAEEIILGLPTCVALAGLAKPLNYAAGLFESDNFHIEASADPIGVQVGGAFKNVLGIAAGLVTGLALGSNARATLLVKGIAEIGAIAEHLGAHSKTIYGQAGLGDIILTCTSEQSRNFRLGLYLGEGLTLAQAKSQLGKTIEGKQTALALLKLIERHSVEAPILSFVGQLLLGNEQAKNIAENL